MAEPLTRHRSSDRRAGLLAVNFNPTVNYAKFPSSLPDESPTQSSAYHPGVEEWLDSESDDEECQAQMEGTLYLDEEEMLAQMEQLMSKDDTVLEAVMTSKRQTREMRKELDGCSSLVRCLHREYPLPLPYEGWTEYSRVDLERRRSVDQTPGSARMSTGTHSTGFSFLSSLRNRDHTPLPVEQIWQVELLHIAVAACRPEASHVQRLLRLKAEVNKPVYFPVRSDSGRTLQASVQAIHLAVSSCNLPGLRALLDAKASHEARATFDGIPDYTPLHLAAGLAQRVRRGDTPRSLDRPWPTEHPENILGKLLEARADLNACDLACVRPVDMLDPLESYSHLFLNQEQSVFQPWSPPVHESLRQNVIVRLVERQMLTRQQYEELMCMLNVEQRKIKKSVLFLEDFRVVSPILPGEPVDCIECEALSERWAHTGHFYFRRLVQGTPSFVVQGYKVFGQRLRELRETMPRADSSPWSPSVHRIQSAPSRPFSGSLHRARTVSATVYSFSPEDSPVVETPNHQGLRHAATTRFSGGGSKSSFMLLDFTINEALTVPLDPRKGRYRRKLLTCACLLHFVVDSAVRALTKSDKYRRQAMMDVRLVITAQADISARAHFSHLGQECTTTALHMAAAGGSQQVVELLLRNGASLEAAATMTRMPDHPPLADAAAEGQEDACRGLLRAKANPDTPDREGRTSLHVAVECNHLPVVKLLVESRANVGLKTRGIGRMKQKLLLDARPQDTDGLTPLDFCDRAKRPYNAAERGAILTLLVPSFNGQGSLLVDLQKVALNSDVAERLIDEAAKKESREAVEQLRTQAVEGRIGAKEPLEIVVSIIENSPVAGVKLLKDILLVVPEHEDPYHGSLPHRANLRVRVPFLPCWRCFGCCTDLGLLKMPLLTDYRWDANQNRREIPRTKDPRLPCWLYDIHKPANKAEPEWHQTFAPPVGQKDLRWSELFTKEQARFYTTGDVDVEVKVLLLSNAVDVRMLNAISRIWKKELYAEMIVQAIINCAFEKVAGRVVVLGLCQEFLLFGVFMRWSSASDQEALGDSQDFLQMRQCWVFSSAMFCKELFIQCIIFYNHHRHGWSVADFFCNGWAPAFRALRLSMLSMLLTFTFRDHSLEHLWNDDGRTLQRGLLGVNIVLLGVQVVFHLRSASPEAEFGRHILSILQSFARLWAILVVTLLFFLSFSAAFCVMETRTTAWEMADKIYRGMLLGDGAGLDAMQGGADVDPNGEHAIDIILTMVATTVFTICLLNISIAVFQQEYDKAVKQSFLLFWQNRARVCTNVMLGPIWPWCAVEKHDLSELERWAHDLLRLAASRLRAASQVRQGAPRWQRFLAWLLSCLGGKSRLEEEDDGQGMTSLEKGNTSPMDKQEEARLEDAVDAELSGFVGLVGHLVLLVLVFLSIFFSALPVPMINRLVPLTLGLSLIQLQAVTVRCDFLNYRYRAKRYFLWVCHRADFSPNHFINEDVEKEQVDAVMDELQETRSRLNKTNEKLDELQGTVAQLRDFFQSGGTCPKPQATTTPGLHPDMPPNMGRMASMKTSGGSGDATPTARFRLDEEGDRIHHTGSIGGAGSRVRSAPVRADTRTASRSHPSLGRALTRMRSEQLFEPL